MTKTMKKYGQISLAILLVSVLLVPVLVSASSGTSNDMMDQLNRAAGPSGAGYKTGGEATSQLPEAIGKIIQIILGFLGIIFIILIIYAGFMWMLAGGDSGKAEKARKYITNAIIGLVIILAAYVITSFVITQLAQSTDFYNTGA